MMELFNKVTHYIKSYNWLNKFSITVLCFTVWIIFLDNKHSVVKQIKLNRQIAELKDIREDYKVKLDRAKEEYADLMQNKEKFAREKYYISKPGEDVYIIE